MRTFGNDEVRRMLNKVPETTFLFWAAKMLATSVGESAADLLNAGLHLGPILNTASMAGITLVAIVYHVRAVRYLPWLYWLSVTFTGVLGTLLADDLVEVIGFSQILAAATYGAALLGTLLAWKMIEGSLSVRTLLIPRREYFYWAAILLTFAFGAAADDFVTEAFGLGYGSSAILLIGLISAAVLASRRFPKIETAAFWITCILTRLFGGSFSDLLSKPLGVGGFGLSELDTGLGVVTAIAALTFYLSLARARSLRADGWV